MSQFQIPQNWVVTNFSDKEFFKDVIGGGTPPRQNPEYFGGRIPWVRLRDMKSKYITKTEETLTEIGLHKSSARLLPINSVILSTRATIGEVSIAKTNLTTNQGFKSIICNEEKIIPEFIYYFLKCIKPILESEGKSTTYAEINRTTLLNIQIAIPPMQTQQKIVKKLDYILGQLEEKKNGILELQKNKAHIIQNLIKNSKGLLFASLLKHERSEVNLLNNLILDIKLGSNQRSIYDPKGIPVLRMPNIRDGKIEYSNLKFSEFSEKDEEKYLLQRGDILVNRTNSAELVGKSAVFEKDEKFAFASYIIRLRVDETRIKPQFLAHYLNSPIGRNYVNRVYIKTAGQANINSEHLKKMPIVLPSIESQEKILKNLEKLNTNMSRLENQLELLKQSEEKIKNHLGNLTNNILRIAFLGKLVN